MIDMIAKMKGMSLISPFVTSSYFFNVCSFFRPIAIAMAFLKKFVLVVFLFLLLLLLLLPYKDTNDWQAPYDLDFKS